MIVTCPQCATQYNLPDAVARQGAKARCAQCKTIFVLRVQIHAPIQAPIQSQTPSQNPPIMADGLPPLSTPPPQQNTMASILGSPNFMQDPTFAPQAMPSHMGQALQYGQQGTAVVNTPPNVHSEHAHADNSYHSAQQQEVGSTPFQSCMTGLLLLAILGMLGFGAWRYMPRLGNDQLEAEANRITYAREQIKDIALHNVRQYTVESAKVGLLLVIEGRAINNFRSPREMIKVEAALYDKDGNFLESTQQLCGVLVSKLQMQILGASEIEAALGNELEAYARNVNIASGTSVPFMIVFMNPPASVASYGVHVVDAQASPSN